MTSPAWELQKSLHATLSADSALVALLGGARIYDRVPRGAAYPYVTFGPAATRDWSTSTEEGSEHPLTFHVWSKGGGEREVHLIASAIRTALHNAALSVAGFRLVNLRHESSDAVRLSDGETTHGIVRLRAVLEPLT